MPRQLSGLDAAFLDTESPTAHMHGVGVIRIVGGEQPMTTEGLAGLLERRLHRLHPLRRRLATVPGGLDQPWWIDSVPDPRHHIVHTVMAPGATWTDFEDLCAEIASVHLDRSLPLWRFWLVDGLPDGEQALVVKIHHSVTDGVGSLVIVSEILDMEADAPGPPPPEKRLEPEPMPSPQWLLSHAARRGLRWPVDAFHAVTELGSSMIRLGRLTLGGPHPDMAAPLRTPRLSMGGEISANRSIAMRELPLDEVLDLAHTMGAHLNDVVLAIVAGALRIWLADHGGIPDLPLVAAVPVSLRTIEELNEPGNRVSACFVHLATQVDDPLERLQVAADAATGAKAAHAAIGTETLNHFVALATPLVVETGMRAYTRLHLPRLHPPAVNLVVSNVHGPPLPLYLDGHRVQLLYALGPIFDNTPLNITVLSYTDRISVGYVACPDNLPDLDALADAQGPAFAELVAAAHAAH